MSFRVIQHILGLLLMAFSLTMLPAVGVGLFYGDGGPAAFLAAVAWLLAVGAATGATGLDQVTAFSAVAATLNNLGPGLGGVAQNYAAIGPVGKWICVLAMLLGRLEIFTLLILFTVTFRRK
jgi:Trk-type K+ transport system membrane component